ncbi:hypothetical protein M199_gp070 [Halogranum tailed virus 1]|uniref:Uncharacterized protein n=1 Tax=Halogranum tailed virus 1 TaxID=1273749 RepID=R4TH33_9CAUD|nr:hypothetical protein M199_gp070 [Halogranum tailed virus 1]AGM11596.1 hypothetical protein HGTV1_299 [Halogranum tailed virus 1]
MAESQSGFDMRAYTNEQDEGMAGVMPDHWDGHTRIASFDAGLTEGQEDLAVRLTNRLVEKKGVPHSKARKAAVKEAAKHDR